MIVKTIYASRLLIQTINWLSPIALTKAVNESVYFYLFANAHAQLLYDITVKTSLQIIVMRLFIYLT